MSVMLQAAGPPPHLPDRIHDNLAFLYGGAHHRCLDPRRHAFDRRRPLIGAMSVAPPLRASGDSPPWQRGRAGPAVRARPIGERSPGPQGTNRLLVVEDDEGCRDLIRRLFSHLDYEVTVAATVAEGLTALDPPPDRILLDLTLPDGPGEALLEKIRSEGLPSRVVVCTGAEDGWRLEGVRKLGPAAVLHKPLDLSELVTACR